MALPYHPETDHGTGFLPLLVRALAHALFVGGANFHAWPMTVEQARANLQEGLDHANAITEGTLTIISDQGKEHIEEWKSATRLLIAAFTTAEGRNPEQQANEHKNAIVAYIQQTFALLALLDQELLGLMETETDAGKLP